MKLQKLNKFFLLAILLIAGLNTAHAQQDTVSKYPSEINKRKLATAITTESVFYLSGMAYLQYAWYHDKERVPFNFYNDNAGYLQVDKFGHAFGAYLESYIGYHWLRKAGVSKKNSLIYGGSLGFVLQAPIEIFDGLYEGWGFSWGDMIANAAGSAFVIGQEVLWDKQLLKYKFSFHRSAYADNANGYLGDNYLESLLYDYNGHTYWVSGPVNMLLPGEPLPAWLNIAIGYSANGMYGEFENKSSYQGVAIPETQRYRQLLLSLDIDWPEIHTRSKFLNFILDGMFFIKLPFPTFEINSKGNVRGYWMYF